MRRAPKVDANQAEIVKALRAAGCSVLSLAPVGHGCPDLLVGLCGRNILLEVKDGSKPPSARKLTPDQVEFFKRWHGQITVVRSAAEAITWARRLPIGMPTSLDLEAMS